MPIIRCEVAVLQQLCAALAAADPRMAAGGTPPHLLLQPAWGNSQGEALAVAFVQSHPAWRLILQSHKWLGVR